MPYLQLRQVSGTRWSIHFGAERDFDPAKAGYGWSEISTVCSDPTEQVLVSAALQRLGPFWFNDLAPVLAQYRWLKLRTDCGIDTSNYGSARVINGSSQTERDVVGYLAAPISEAQNRIIVECLRPCLAERYRDCGLEFYLPSEIVRLGLCQILNRAMQIISSVQGAAASVSAVLSTVHILKPESPQCDVSYSEPILPFSIFVGVDPEVRLNRDIRVAEGILHECMHLQLSLIEDITPLVADNNENYLSPWRQTVRPTSGVLHALYVFRVIQDFFGAILTSANIGQDERNYAKRRIEEIDAEVDQVEDLSSSQDLTAAGSALVERLTAGNDVKAR